MHLHVSRCPIPKPGGQLGLGLEAVYLRTSFGQRRSPRSPPRADVHCRLVVWQIVIKSIQFRLLEWPEAMHCGPHNCRGQSVEHPIDYGHGTTIEGFGFGGGLASCLSPAGESTEEAMKHVVGVDGQGAAEVELNGRRDHPAEILVKADGTKLNPAPEVH